MPWERHWNMRGERQQRLMSDEKNTLHHFYWKIFIWSKYPKGKFWLNLFSSGGLQEELNWCLETLLSNRTENSVRREFSNCLAYVLVQKYNKDCTHCLPIRYFIYAMEAYSIYFSKNRPFQWAFFVMHMYYLFLSFWKYML